MRWNGCIRIVSAGSRQNTSWYVSGPANPPLFSIMALLLTFSYACISRWSLCTLTLLKHSQTLPHAITLPHACMRYNLTAHASVLEALSETMLRGIEADASALECVFAIQSGETLLTGIRLKRPGARSSVHQPAAVDGGDGNSTGADTDVLEHVPAALAPLRRNERVRELLAQHQQDRQSATTRALDPEMQRRSAMSSCVAAAAVLSGRSLASTAFSTRDDPHWLQARTFFEGSVIDDKDQEVAANAGADRCGSTASSSSADLQGSAAGSPGIGSRGSSSKSALAIKPQSLTAPALAWLRRWAIDAVLDLVRGRVMTREIIFLLYFDSCAQLCIDTTLTRFIISFIFANWSQILETQPSDQI